MNVRKKEGRSMRRNNYLPVTRDPQFRGASVSLHLASVRPVTMVRVLREVQTERGRGEPGGGRQHLSLQEPAGGSAQMQQPCSQGAQWEGKTETLNWVIQAPQTLECSPQPSMSHCCPCQAPRHPASAPLPCTCLHLPRGLLFTQPTPSPPQGLKLDATSCKKPLGDPGTSRPVLPHPPPSPPSTVSQQLWNPCWRRVIPEPCRLVGEKQGQVGPSPQPLPWHAALKVRQLQTRMHNEGIKES